ncbi:MAG TPA: ion channel [Gemmatimonadaceae bacterium]|jgi:hypothetical protein|nr:ion channel [Gemmatimonadaceae bacterium]
MRTISPRWSDLALTFLGVELALASFVVAPLAVLAPKNGVALPLLVIALVAVPVLLAAVLVASASGPAVSGVFVAGGFVLSGLIYGLRGPSVIVTYLHLIGALVLGTALMVAVARAVFGPGPITYHRLTGAAVLYLLIGWTFAGVYGTLGLLLSHPFNGMPPREDGAAVVAHSLYYSFMALTTAGLGDVTPAHPVIRGLTNLETVVGQIFPATVIARILSLAVASKERHGSGGLDPE